MYHFIFEQHKKGLWSPDQVTQNMLTAAELLISTPAFGTITILADIIHSFDNVQI